MPELIIPENPPVQLSAEAEIAKAELDWAKIRYEGTSPSLLPARDIETLMVGFRERRLAEKIALGDI